MMHLISINIILNIYNIIVGFVIANSLQTQYVSMMTHYGICYYFKVILFNLISPNLDLFHL